ncbi:MAG: ribose 5-phosphate isomerase B [Planctomycetota bacterium]
MIVSIGSDHRGIQQRANISNAIESCGHTCVDHGTHSTDSFDYPDIVVPVCESVIQGKSDRAIMICGTGIGVSIAANKIPGIRAAVCHDLHTAKLSRSHNDANVLCMAAEAISPERMKEMITLWLSVEFEGGRHGRRIEKIHKIELQYSANPTS